MVLNRALTVIIPPLHAPLVVLVLFKVDRPLQVVPIVVIVAACSAWLLELGAWA